MNPPTCDFCGKSEWRHVCSGTPILQKKHIASKISKTDGIVVCPTCGHTDRNAYMREYMKKYRAKIKALEA